MIHKEKEYDYYMGIRKFIKEKSLLNMDMIFDKYPNEIFHLTMIRILRQIWSLKL